MNVYHRLPAPFPALAAVMLALALMITGIPAFAADQEGQAPDPPESPELHEHLDLSPETDAQLTPARAQIELAPLVRRLLEDDLTSDARRTELRIFHGQWDDLDRDALSLDQRGQLALLEYRLDASVLENADVDPLLRAEAALRRGEPERVIELLDPEADARSALLCARAYEDMGDLARAKVVLRPWRQMLQRRRGDLATAVEVAAAARAVVMLAHLEGRPAQDYQFAMDQLGRAHQQLDALHWPAHLAEAEILIEKDNAPEAAAALHETLTLNPRNSEAWYRFGRFAVERFDFDNAESAIETLREINSEHLLADNLEAHMRLMQRDPDTARDTIADARQRYPTNRRLIELQAAAEALRYDEQAMRIALERYDELAPGSPRAHFTVGVYLSLARQYDAAEAALREAIARQPHWPAPHVELGLLLMQSGDNEAARRALGRAVQLDPFNRRAGNQLTLVEALLEYATIETDNFIIRYKPGIDAALAHDVARHVEDLYSDITTIFQHQPGHKTQIDIMPDEQWFGVRITGMPDIWTIAAATGDVISLTPPRTGPRQRGTFDWANVLRHEYVHTVNLSQTDNRVPHWFTEACAVAEELTGRDYQSAQLLAWALHNNKLFTLEDINWGFIRPSEPYHRSLAYAQAHWMLEFIRETAGNDAVIALLDRYGKGMGNVAAIEEVLETDQDRFMAHFRSWAQGQVRQWGLEPPPNDPRVMAILADDSRPVDVAEVEALIERHGEHPALLRLLAEAAVAGENTASALDVVRRYADARPSDPWAQRQLARLALDIGREDEAIRAIETLDRGEGYHGDWAHQLALLHRRAGRLDAAADAVERALRREPYNAGYRELAATVNLQRGAPRDALHHLRALGWLEPERAQHHIRLAALYRQLDEPEAMRRAARRAREIDPEAPVERFLTVD